jgi:hypothetical protein
VSNGRFICLALAAVLVGVGCGKSRAPASEGPTLSEGRPTQAQPRLPTVRLWLGTNELTAEVARTTQQLMTGMMFRTEMAEEEGMLFVFETPHRVQFVLETRQGWFERNHVRVGALVRTERGALADTLIGRR